MRRSLNCLNGGPYLQGGREGGRFHWQVKAWDRRGFQSLQRCLCHMCSNSHPGEERTFQAPLVKRAPQNLHPPWIPAPHTSSTFIIHGRPWEREREREGERERSLAIGVIIGLRPWSGGDRPPAARGEIRWRQFKPQTRRRRCWLFVSFWSFMLWGWVCTSMQAYYILACTIRGPSHTICRGLLIRTHTA
jgi:hypothetical protein